MPQKYFENLALNKPGVFARTPRLLLVGDSLNARGGNTFAALGGHSGEVVAIAPGPLAGQATLTFALAHGLPVGSPVRISSDSTVHPGLRNRWFNFTSTGATSGVITAQPDHPDAAYLSTLLNSPAIVFSGSAELSIDAVEGWASSYCSALFALGAPFDVVNLCVPGARTGRAAETDLLALVNRVTLADYTHIGITAGINDMAQSLSALGTIENLANVVSIALNNQLHVFIDTITPQSTMGAPALAFIRDVNAAIRRMAGDHVTVVDAYPVVADSTTGAGTAQDLADGTHFNGTGALRIGLARAKALQRWTNSAPIAAPNGLTNPQLAGTGGTVDAPVTGQCATSWRVFATGSNVTCKAAKWDKQVRLWRRTTAYVAGNLVRVAGDEDTYYVCVTAGTSAATSAALNGTRWQNLTDGTAVWQGFPARFFAGEVDQKGQWQYLEAIVGPSSSSQERVTLTQTVTLATAGKAPGDKVRAALDVRFIGSECSAFMLTLRTGNFFGTGAGNKFGFAAAGAKNTFFAAGFFPTDGLDGRLVTPEFVVPASQTALEFYIELIAGSDMPGAEMRALVGNPVFF